MQSRAGRTGARPSISSKKMIDGCAFCASCAPQQCQSTQDLHLHMHQALHTPILILRHVDSVTANILQQKTWACMQKLTMRKEKHTHATLCQP